MSGSNLLFILTGSIAAYKACDVVSRLVKRGHSVRIVATESALRFVGPATLEGLTGTAVLSDLFAPGAALEHIRLMRWAQACVVCPATANTLNRFATGLADDLAGALFLAHDWTKPFLVAPAMNPSMWKHPATQASVSRLESWGVRFIAPDHGHLACGEEGEGRLAEPADVVAEIECAVRRPMGTLRVLITSGGTAEPVDGVRVLTNTSTGRTGAGIAAYFARRGHQVTLLRAANSAASEVRCDEETFRTFAELDSALTRRLGPGKFDVVIHAAAVGDFGIEAVVVDGVSCPPGRAKIDSGSSPLLLLKPQPKLVEVLRARSGNDALKIVAFKLTHGAEPSAAWSAVMDLFDRTQADYVVHNDLRSRQPAPGDFPADIYQPNGKLAISCPTRADLSVALERLLAQGSEIA